MGKSDDQRKVEEITRILLGPLASPLPLAFFTFGVESILQSASQLGAIPQEESRNFALVFGGSSSHPCFWPPSWLSSREALEGGIDEQIGPVEKEAGVRKQL